MSYAIRAFILLRCAVKHVLSGVNAIEMHIGTWMLRDRLYDAKSFIVHGFTGLQGFEMLVRYPVWGSRSCSIGFI